MDHEVTETMDRTLSVVGAGRAGAAFAVAAVHSGWRVAAVASRSPAHADALAAATGARSVRTPAQAARAAALTIVAVPDTEIVAVAARVGSSGVALDGHVVAHCSARHSADLLAAVRQSGAATGVVHPLQALTGAESAPLLHGSHFRVEGDERALHTLQAFVADLGGALIDVPLAARTMYHAAAVLAGNAPLVLLERATQLLVDAGVDAATAHSALAALLEGAAGNARRAGSAAALTGPVARGDAETVRAHLEALAVDTDARELYVHLAREMLLLAGPDGRGDIAAALDSALKTPRPRIADTQVA